MTKQVPRERKAIKIRLLYPGECAVLNPARKSRWLRRITGVTPHFSDFKFSSLVCGHRLLSSGEPQVGDLVLCTDCRREGEAQRARERADKGWKRRHKELKWMTVTFGVDPELLKELRWIARRDGVTFKSLIVEGLYHARDHSYIPEDCRPIAPKRLPPEQSTIQ